MSQSDSFLRVATATPPIAKKATEYMKKKAPRIQSLPKAWFLSASESWTKVIYKSNNIYILIFLLAIVLSVLFRFTNSDYPFGIIKLFLYTNVVDIC